MLRFLSFHQQLTKEHLDLLWKCQEGKHEATVLGVFETIIEVSLELSIESLDYIFSKIESIPLKKYNEQVLNFVKDFTMNACKVVKHSKSREIIDIDSDDEEEKLQEFYIQNAKGIVDGQKIPPNDFGSQYGIPIIWKLLHEPTELGMLALNAFLELIKCKYCTYLKMDYIMKCIKNLQDGEAVYQSLEIMTNVIPKRYSQKRFTSNKLQFALGALQKEFDLIALTIQNIEKYNEVVQKAMVQYIDKNIELDEIPKM